MLTVRMYKNYAKRTNSTKQPDSNVSYTDFSCSLKDNCTVLSPVVDIYLATGDPASLGYNYAYIAAYSRYYFVDEWTYTFGVWTAHMSVDVLASYKADIGAETHYVLRTTNAYTLDSSAVRVPELKYPVTHSKQVITTGLAVSDRPFVYSNGTFVIGIINGGTTTNLNGQGSIKYYVATAAQINTLISYLMDNTFSYTYLEDESIGLTEAATKSFVDPLQYIANLRWYPFAVTASSTAERPIMGFWDTSNDTNIPALYPVANLTQLITNSSLTVYHNPHRLESGKEFTDFAPYINYKLYFDPFGVFDLDAGLLAGRTGNQPIYMSITVDFVTGMAKLDLGTTSTDCELGSKIAYIGVDIELAQVTQSVMSAGYGKWLETGNKVAAWLGEHMGFDSTFTDSVGKVFGKSTGIGSAMGLTGDISVNRSGINGSMLPYAGYNIGPILITEYYDVVGVDPDEYGQPLCKKVQISSCSGYVQCGNVETEAGSMLEERNRINDHLRGGFYYE